MTSSDPIAAIERELESVTPAAARRWDDYYPGGQWLYFPGDHDGEKLYRYAELLSLARKASSAEARADKAEALAERLKLDAQAHAMEARTANSTIYEIYQCVSGATGEPGNWHGAEPVRERLEALRREADAMREKAIANARERNASEARVSELERENAELRGALEKIEKAPAWGAPDKWETTPAAVRHIARAALKKQGWPL